MDTEQAIVFVKDLEGAYVECGVFEGRHPRLCAEATLRLHLPIRDIYMFDTFEGLTEPGEFDFTRDDSVLYTMSRTDTHQEWERQRREDVINGWCYCSLDQVRFNVEQTGYPLERLFYIKGDVCKTLLEPQNIPEKIAVLRLDTDWYESSKIELEVLYDRVVPGGVIIFDDYYHWDGQRKATDDFFHHRGIDVTLSRVNCQTASMIRK